MCVHLLMGVKTLHSVIWNWCRFSPWFTLEQRHSSDKKRKKNWERHSYGFYTILGAVWNCSVHTRSHHERLMSVKTCSFIWLKSYIWSRINTSPVNSQQQHPLTDTIPPDLLLCCGKHVDTCVAGFFCCCFFVVVFDTIMLYRKKEQDAYSSNQIPFLMSQMLVLSPALFKCKYLRNISIIVSDALNHV